MATEEKVTDAQAAAAFSAFTKEAEAVPAVEAEPSPVEPAKVEEAVAEEEVQETAPAKSDDLIALEKRLEESEAREKEREDRFTARMQALQTRNAESERILRDRYLRKSTATDKALRVLKAAKSETGVEPAEADRVIAELEATMNPSSHSYAPPPTHNDTEEQALVLNRFLNEQGMDGNEADQFGKWIRSEGASALSVSEQAVASESLDGFLRIAHNRWRSTTAVQTKQQKVDDAVAAVKSVQRTQRQAARAAEVTGGAPKKQPTKTESEVDVRKLTADDVARLVRQATEQYLH